MANALHTGKEVLPNRSSRWKTLDSGLHLPGGKNPAHLSTTYTNTGSCPIPSRNLIGVLTLERILLIWVLTCQKQLGPGWKSNGSMSTCRHTLSTNSIVVLHS